MSLEIGPAHQEEIVYLILTSTDDGRMAETINEENKMKSAKEIKSNLVELTSRERIMNREMAELKKEGKNVDSLRVRIEEIKTKILVLEWVLSK